MGFLQKIHLVIKYKKKTTKNLANFLSIPPTPKIITLNVIMHMNPFTHREYREEYVEDDEFKGV